MNNASWASRAYGVSRAEALSSGPTVVVLDSRGNAKGQARAYSAEPEHVLAAAAVVPAAEAAPAAVAAVKPAVNATPRPAATAQAARTATAQAKPLSGRQAQAATTEVARSEAPAESPR